MKPAAASSSSAATGRTRSIRIVSAGAGSGKTHRLTRELIELLLPQRPNPPIRPEAVIATTFTRRAATELAERVRQALLDAGRPNEAQRIEAGYIGTVNSVCGRLLERFAFEAGISPAVNVIAEEEQSIVFKRAIAPVLESGAGVLVELSARLGVENWEEVVRKLVEASRANRLDPTDLGRCASRSWKGLEEFLPAMSAESAGDLDRRLLAAIEQTSERIRGDDKKNTSEYLDLLREATRHLRAGWPMPWATWVKIKKARPAAAWREPAETLAQVAACYNSHPRFREDVRGFIEGVFDLAARSLDRYEAYKRELGLVDFVDQEALVLGLLDSPAVRERAMREIDALLVDEFQDTSPVQLALFLKLSEFARQTIWVGDPKQSIFAFRGTDPSLMEACVKALGGIRGEDVLRISYRSRPPLVEMVNRVFSAALRDKYPPEQVELAPDRREPDGVFGPAIHHWHVAEAGTKEGFAAGMAWALCEFLDSAPAVQDKARGADRKAEPGDVAVLCWTNDECEEVSRALAERGFEIAHSRPGLATTSEAKLVQAALRRLLSSFDTLATAEIVALTSPDSTPEKWLQDRLEFVAAGRPDPGWAEDHPEIRTLQTTLRPNLNAFSPSEAIDHVVEALDIRRRVARWGGARQRLANLEEMRRLAVVYEEACCRDGRGASIQGFLFWLADLAKEGRDTQGAGTGPEAVNVLTYHKAKGLEWPVVIAWSLETPLKTRLWNEPEVLSDREEIDVEHPLGGRWIRYWPWPYGRQEKDTGLGEAVEGSPPHSAAVNKAQAEEVRLLYVGLTRARDYLILPTRSKKERPIPAQWLERILDKAGLKPGLPLAAGATDLAWARQVATTSIVAVAPPQDPSPSPRMWVRERRGPSEHLPARVSPSSMAASSEGAFSVGRVIRYGRRIPIRGKPDMDRLGEGLHAFIAWDDPSRKEDPQRRLVVCQRLLKAHGVEDAVKADDVIAQANEFHQILRGQLGAARRVCEWPLGIREKNGQVVEGVVDMLVEATSGWVVVDHKAFPGPSSEWGIEALTHAGQLEAYARIVEAATERPVVGTWINFFVVGGLIELARTGAPA